MTNYTILVHEKGKDGFRVIGHADANTPKQAVEAMLGGTNNSVTEGIDGRYLHRECAYSTSSR